MSTTRTHLLAAAVAALLAGVGGFATEARAQPEDPEAKREARKLLESGDRKLQRGERLREREKEEEAREQYAAALRDYQAAFDVYPRPQIYFPIALAEQKLGRFLDAHRHYQQLLAEVPSLSPAVKSQVRKHLSEVKRDLGAVRFVIVPDGASVTVDGNEIGVAPLDEPYWLTPGTHSYEIRAKGFSPVTAELELPRGGVIEEAVTLEKIPDKVEEPEPTVELEKKDEEPRGPSRLPLWIGLGATGALAATATVTGILAVSEHGTFTDETRDPAARRSARDAGKTLALTTDLLMVATAAAGAYTAYYYDAIYRPEQEALVERQEAERAEREADTPLWLSPYASAQGGGLAVGGRF